MAVELVFEKKPKWVLSLRDSVLMIKRSSLHIIRNIDQMPQPPFVRKFAPRLNCILGNI